MAAVWNEGETETACLKGEGYVTLPPPPSKDKYIGFHPFFKEQDEIGGSLLICIFPHGTGDQL